MMNGTFEQLRAAVYGQAVGDALGVPYEFMPRDAFRCEGMTGYGTHNQPIGTWSDDTSMMLATLDSLIANEWQVNTEDMGERYLAWLSNGEYAIDGRVFDCGRTVSVALQQRVGLSGERDNGNGSLMRSCRWRSRMLPRMTYVPHLQSRTPMQSRWIPVRAWWMCCATDSSKAYGRKSWMMNRYAVCRVMKLVRAASSKTRMRRRSGASRIPMIMRVVCSPPSTWVTIQTRPPPSPDTWPHQIWIRCHSRSVAGGIARA